MRLTESSHRYTQKQPNFVECFTTRLLRPDADAEAEDIVKWAAGGLYAGASDTVNQVLLFLLPA